MKRVFSLFIAALMLLLLPANTIKTNITSSAYNVDIALNNFRNVIVAEAIGPGNAILSVNLTANKTYYIKVSEANNKTPTYTLYING